MKSTRLVVLPLVAALALLALWWWTRTDAAPSAGDVAVLARPSGAAPAADAAQHVPLPAPRPAQAPMPLGAAAAGEHAADGAAPTAASAPAFAPLELSLSHAGGAPASGTTVLLCRDNKLLASAVTDGAGRAQLPGVDGAAQLLVGGASDVPIELPLASGSGAQSVSLPPGLVVAGQVLVDGGRPERPFLLALHTLPQGRPMRTPIDVGSALHISVPGLAQDALANAQLVGIDGRFRFSALPAPWQGTFDIGYQFAPRAADGTLAVQAPAENVLLDLRSPVSVHGRVVPQGGGEGVVGAAIDFEFFASGGSRSTSFLAGPDGRFVIPGAFYDTAIDGLTLSIHHPEGQGACAVRYSAADLARLHGDLGDIELQSTRGLHFVVHDTSGAPVPGAFAVADDGSAERSAATDGEGRAELVGMLTDTPTMTVWAHRFREQQVALPPASVELDEEHALVVVLQRCPTLDVFVSGPQGSNLPNLLVAISGEQQLFSSSGNPDGSGFTPDLMAYSAGMTASTTSSSRSTRDAAGRRVLSGAIGFLVPHDGHVSLSGLLPGVTFELSVQGAVGGMVWGPQTLSLLPDEAREVHVELARGPTALAVRVVDPQTRPLPGATVSVSWPGKITGDFSLSVGADGIVKLPHMYAETITLHAECTGFAARTLRDVPVARDGVPLDVVLEPGLVVNVLVHDAAGRGVPAEWLKARFDDHLAGSASVAPGGDRSRWRIEELPAAGVLLVAQVAGRRFEQAHDSRVPDAEFLVPATGALRLRLDLPIAAGTNYVVHVREPGAAPGAADADWSTWLGEAELAARELLLPAVLPGDHEVSLWRVTDGAEQPCSRPASVRVSAGATAELLLVAP